MSYAQVNPPPTAGPLPVVDSASLGVPYYAPASGGGGGGGSGSATLSTIIIPPGGQNLTINNADTGNFQDYLFSSSPGNSFNAFTVFAPNNPNIGLALVADNFGNTRISGNNTVEFLTPVSTLALFVSSINGAAPAGGGVSPAGISTAQVAGSAGALTLSGTNSITMTALNVNALGVPNFNLGNGNLVVSSINGAAPGGGGVDAAGISTNQVASATQSKLNLYGGSIATYVSVDSGNDVITLAANQVDAVNADLLVSSINGNAPGGNVIANLSVASLSSGFVLAPGGAPVVPLTSSFATTVGHIYQLSWTDVTQVTGSGATPNSYLQYTLSTPSAFQGLDLVPGPPLEAIAASTIVSHIANFNALADSAQLVIAPNGMPSTTLTLATGQDIILRDLGPVS